MTTITIITILNIIIIINTITKSSQSPNHPNHLVVEVVEVWLRLSCDVGCRQPGARAFEKLYDLLCLCLFWS